MTPRFILGTFLIGSLLVAGACAQGSETGIGGSGTTSATGTGTGGSTSSSSSSSSSGATTSSSSSSSSSSGGSTSSSSSSSSSGSAVTPEHLMISEIGTQPAGGEFIEIWNPTGAAVDLSNYYISDNSIYHGIAAGKAWAPVTSTGGTDFLAQFPAGTTLAPDAVLVIATDAGFEAMFSKCPDFILSASPLTCASGGTAKAMIAPTNGGIGDKVGTLLSNDREMVVLFTWDGTASTVKDVDYVTWGTTFDENNRMDKTGVAGYAAETPRASQKSAPAPAPAAGTPGSIERCAIDSGEAKSGGNGITGHDETSEDLGTSFVPPAAPSPGVKNSCLP